MTGLGRGGGGDGNGDTEERSDSFMRRLAVYKRGFMERETPVWGYSGGRVAEMPCVVVKLARHLSTQL